MPELPKMPGPTEPAEPEEEPCDLLAWDSGHFGRRIGRVRGGRLTPGLVAHIDLWVARQEVECLYFLADLTDRDTPPLAAASGFRLVDVRVTLERRGGTSAYNTEVLKTAAAASEAGGSAAGAEGLARRAVQRPAVAIRPATTADLPVLRGLAAASHHDSRFYFDPHFDRARCDALYMAWIERSCRDPHGVVLVAAPAFPGSRPPNTSSGGAPGVGTSAGAPDIAGPGGAPAAAGSGAAPADSPIAGYVTAVVEPDGAGRIGLLAVAAAAHGQGTGGRLVEAALGWFAARGAEPVRVVTQGRNLRAQRLYQRFALRTTAVELWYHRWSEGGAMAAPGRR